MACRVLQVRIWAGRGWVQGRSRSIVSPQAMGQGPEAAGAGHRSVSLRDRWESFENVNGPLMFKN